MHHGALKVIITLVFLGFRQWRCCLFNQKSSVYSCFMSISSLFVCFNTGLDGLFVSLVTRSYLDLQVLRPL